MGFPAEKPWRKHRIQRGEVRVKTDAGVSADWAGTNTIAVANIRSTEFACAGVGDTTSYKHAVSGAGSTALLFGSGIAVSVQPTGQALHLFVRKEFCRRNIL